MKLVYTALVSFTILSIAARGIPGDGEKPLGLLLPDDVLVELRLDLGGLGQVFVEMDGLLLDVLHQHFVAELDALVADVHTRAGHDLFDLIGTLAAERTTDFGFGGTSLHDSSVV